MTKTLDVASIPFNYDVMRPQLAQLAPDVNGNPGQYVLGIPAGCAFICLHCKLQLAPSVIGTHQNLLKPKCKNMRCPLDQPVSLVSFNVPPPNRARRNRRDDPDDEVVPQLHRDDSDDDNSIVADLSPRRGRRKARTPQPSVSRANESDDDSGSNDSDEESKISEDDDDRDNDYDDDDYNVQVQPSRGNVRSVLL